MDKNIFNHQNDEYLLKCIVAQRQEYRQAKKANNVKSIVTVIFAAFTVLSSALDNDILTAITCLFAIVLLIVSQRIDSYTLKKRRHAASIQQYVDVELFSTVAEQDATNWGTLPSKTDLAESISSIDTSETELAKNWYSNYSKLPPIKQIFYCQKENIRWDSKLRSEFRVLLIIVYSVILAALVVITFAINPSLVRFICVFSWFLPIIDYCYSFGSNRAQDTRRFERLKEDSENIEKLLQNDDFRENYIELIELQNKIKDNRENAALIPDWFYKQRKEKHQSAEDKIAEELQKSG